MATETAVGTKQTDLKERVVSKIVELGCACPVDLAGQIGADTRADELVPVLHSLVESGVLRRKENEPGDTRNYEGEMQTIYELNKQRRGA